MATVDDVREILRNLPPISVEGKVEDVFILKGRSVEFQLSDSDVDQYLSVRDSVSIDPETAVFVPGYYEHAVDILSPFPVPRSIFQSRGDEKGLRLQSPDKLLQFELSSISVMFLLALIDKSDGSNLRGFFRRDPGPGRRTEVRPEKYEITDMFYRVETAKVMSADDFGTGAEYTQLRALAEACLFNISCAKGIGLALSRSWERSRYRLGIRRNHDVQFPRRTYQSDLLAHYQLALASDSLILSYLSLYKILEYFYLTTAEAVLHKRMREKLAAPSFSLRTAQLRELAALVRKFDQRTDEAKMLVHVIESYFMPDEIIDWVNQHESSTRKYYTIPQNILGLEHKVDLNSEQIAASIAKRIYHIRNTLVHNKEGEMPRFLPFTGQEEVLERELPLLLFLAEQLIVKSGKDL